MFNKVNAKSKIKSKNLFKSSNNLKNFSFEGFFYISIFEKNLLEY